MSHVHTSKKYTDETYLRAVANAGVDMHNRYTKSQQKGLWDIKVKRGKDGTEQDTFGY